MDVEKIKAWDRTAYGMMEQQTMSATGGLHMKERINHACPYLGNCPDLSTQLNPQPIPVCNN